MITKLNNRELFQFCEQFSIILRSGMSAIEGLAILNDDSQTEWGKEILTFLSKDMEESGSLAHAMEQSGAFPASAAAYVRTGEETGCLDEVMKGLSAFYAKEIQITDQIRHSPHIFHGHPVKAIHHFLRRMHSAAYGHVLSNGKHSSGYVFLPEDIGAFHLLFRLIQFFFRNAVPFQNLQFFPDSP